MKRTMLSLSFRSKANLGEDVPGLNLFRSVHQVDDNGRPCGGYSQFARNQFIYWQNGPVDRGRPIPETLNGAFVEDVLEACRQRLDVYQSTAFPCEENAEAIKHIEAALLTLERRRLDRRARGVEGVAQA